MLHNFLNKKLFLLLICLCNFHISPHSLRLINNSGKTIKLTQIVYSPGYYFPDRSKYHKELERPIYKNFKLRNKKEKTFFFFFLKPEVPPLVVRYEMISMIIDDKIQIIIPNKVTAEKFCKEIHSVTPNRSYCFEILEKEGGDLEIKEGDFMKANPIDKSRCIIL